jgi:NitT/TauT family transport system substrate-binding protein
VYFRHVYGLGEEKSEEMSMRRALAAALMSLMTVLPASAANTKIKIMVGGIDKQIYLPAKLTESLGYFKDEGLDVELYNSTSGSQAATALLAREVQGVVGFYDHTIDLQSKGQALGVTGLGSATDFLTRALAAKAGLKPQDYTLVPVGAGDTFLSALQQGKIAGGMTTEPTVARSIKMGIAKVGIDLRTPESTRAALGGDYPASCLYMDAGWLAENKDTAQKIVTAFVKTLKWIQAHSAEEITDKMPKDYYAGERDLYVEGLKDGKAQYSPDGLLPEGAPQSVLAILVAAKPELAAKKIDLSKTFTTELVARANATN